MIPQEAQIQTTAHTLTYLSDVALLEMLKVALSNGTLVMAFQAVVDAKSVVRRPAYYEGLIRVQDQNGAIIPAARFLPQIEEDDLGREVDCAALKLGLEALQKKPDLKLAINLSILSLVHNKWWNILNTELGQDPELARRLFLEISASRNIKMTDTMMVQIQTLQRQGIMFAFDDFGAGHTALCQLKDYRFDIMKIDGTFIRDVDTDQDNQCIVRALISIAKQLKMITVAEMVETRKEAEFLVRAGIDCLQGYYYSMPEVFPSWLEEWEKIPDRVLT